MVEDFHFVVDKVYHSEATGCCLLVKVELTGRHGTDKPFVDGY